MPVGASDGDWTIIDNADYRREVGMEGVREVGSKGVRAGGEKGERRGGREPPPLPGYCSSQENLALSSQNLA